MVDGKKLLEWGLKPGDHFPAAMEAAREALAAGGDPRAAALAIQAQVVEPRRLPLREANSLPHGEFIEPEDDVERANVEAVRETMAELSRTPVLSGTAVMPDACPAGKLGTIPVGGIAASSEIHPGMHSADICCSVAISVLGDVDPRATLDTAQAVTHFGGGGRMPDKTVEPPAALMASFASNQFLAGLEKDAVQHFATQGDGNHFLFVGRLRSTGEVALVTHHGSRKPGAMLYKRGMAAAEAVRRRVSRETLRTNAWIEADSADGEAYWDALQVIRAWTKANHYAIHDMISPNPRERYWNEHNFVFRRGDTFLHGKGATPAWRDYADDASGRVLIPLNMGAPILIAEGLDRPDALGFCPHGAGRNISRSAHIKLTGGAHDDLSGIDVRWFSGIADPSEMPSAYKRADAIEAQIERFGLAKVVDHVDPYGSIMAGDWQVNAPWRKKRR
ncbi:MAG: RtcB family protein [Pseudomonadota bacterium]